jgi:hypothetical protein
MTAADSRRHANAAQRIFCCFVSLELSIPLLEVIHAPDYLQARQPQTSKLVEFSIQYVVDIVGMWKFQ